MFKPITTPEEFVRVLKKEIVERVWFTLGNRTLVIKTNNNIYSDKIISYSLTQDNKLVLVLKCGVVMKVDFVVDGRTVYLLNLNKVDDIISL